MLKGALVEVEWLDITERDIEPHQDPDVVELAPCKSWGLLVDDGAVVRIVREIQGETRTVQAFPRSCVKKMTELVHEEKEELQPDG